MMGALQVVPRYELYRNPSPTNHIHNTDPSNWQGLIRLRYDWLVIQIISVTYTNTNTYTTQPSSSRNSQQILDAQHWRNPQRATVSKSSTLKSQQILVHNSLVYGHGSHTHHNTEDDRSVWPGNRHRGHPGRVGHHCRGRVRFGWGNELSLKLFLCICLRICVCTDALDLVRCGICGNIEAENVTRGSVFFSLKLFFFWFETLFLSIIYRMK